MPISSFEIGRNPIFAENLKNTDYDNDDDVNKDDNGDDDQDDGEGGVDQKASLQGNLTLHCITSPAGLGLSLAGRSSDTDHCFAGPLC